MLAQSPSGNIKGMVYDAENGASIHINSVNHSSVSDENGEFSLNNIPEGKYILQIQSLYILLNNIEPLLENKSLKEEAYFSSSYFLYNQDIYLQTKFEPIQLDIRKVNVDSCLTKMNPGK